MLHITPIAKAEHREMLDRLAPGGSEQKNVLLPDRVTSEPMKGFTLDLAKTPKGKKLTIR